MFIFSQKLSNTFILDTYVILSSHPVLASPYPIALPFNIVSDMPNTHITLIRGSSLLVSGLINK